MTFLRFNFKTANVKFINSSGSILKSLFSTIAPQPKSVELLRNSLPVDLQSALRPDLSAKQLSSAVKMVSKGLSTGLPSHWYIEKPPRAELPRPGSLEGWSTPLRKTGGRNHHGKITVRHRGGGFKRRIRILDTERAEDFDKEAWIVERLEHDPNRSAKIALIRGKVSGDLRYILATEKMIVGSLISNNQGPQDGACLKLRDIPLGSQIHSIESQPGRGGQLVRSAGTCATLVGKDLDGIRGSVRLPSGSIKKLLLTCRAVIGRVGNIDWQNRVIGKAGRNRNLGWRPTVRGVAMNAVDHPHGGGKGGRSKVDKKEINQLYSSFVKECPTGKMSRDDLLRIYRQFFPFGHATPFVDRLIKILSNNVDGMAIEFSEYVMGLSVISRGRLDEKLYWSFKFCDFDGDGWISREDLVESIELIHQLMGNIFQATNEREKEESADENDENKANESAENNADAHNHLKESVLTPQMRADQLFTQMDTDNDGKADFSDFKRTVLNDAEIIQGFLVYDGVI